MAGNHCQDRTSGSASTGRHPSSSRVAPNRAADYNGWFNHPVGLTFQAVDQTSGVASCSSTTYGGPDGLGAAIGGSCTDVAGNTASGSFPLNYDATPPERPSVEALPGNKRVAVAWPPSPGAEAWVVRIRKRGAPKLIYRGPNASFTDRKLRNGRRYRYRVTLVDQAGNRSADGASAVPTASPLLRPADGAHLRRAPLLVWKRVKRASYYNAQLVRGGTKILSSWPRKPRLQLHRRWRFDHRVRRLVAGHYCWYVWPGLGARSERPVRPTARQELLHRRALNGVAGRLMRGGVSAERERARNPARGRRDRPGRCRVPDRS